MDLTKVYSKLFLEDVAARIYARDGLGKISIGDVGGFIRDLVGRTDIPGQTKDDSDADRASPTGLERETLRHHHERPARRSPSFRHVCREPGRVPIQVDRGSTERAHQAEQGDRRVGNAEG